MDDGYADAPRIRKPAGHFGKRKEEQAVEIWRMAYLPGEHRRGQPLPDGFTIDHNARRDADQRTHNDVTGIVNAEESPRQSGECGEDAEEKAPRPGYQPKTGSDGKKIGRVVARETAPVLKVGMPFESRLVGSDA